MVWVHGGLSFRESTERVEAKTDADQTAGQRNELRLTIVQKANRTIEERQPPAQEPTQRSEHNRGNTSFKSVHPPSVAEGLSPGAYYRRLVSELRLSDWDFDRELQDCPAE